MSWVLTALAVASVVLRYFRAPAGARRQLRWPAAAAALLLVGLVVAFLGFNGGIVLQVVPFVISVVGPAGRRWPPPSWPTTSTTSTSSSTGSWSTCCWPAPSRSSTSPPSCRATAVPRRGAAVLAGHRFRSGAGQSHCAAGPRSVAAVGGSDRLRPALDAVSRAGHLRGDVGRCVEPAGHRAATGRAAGRRHRRFELPSSTSGPTTSCCRSAVNRARRPASRRSR